VLAREDAFGAEDDLDVVQAIGQAHQEFDAAGEGDALQGGEAIK
jgi:hypothetical protein